MRRAGGRATGLRGGNGHARAADIFQPDPAFCGGITEAMRIAALASAFNLRLAPHLWAGVVEFSVGANPMIHELIEEEVAVREGMIEVPDRPGLGFTIAERFLADHVQAGP